MLFGAWRYLNPVHSAVALPPLIALLPVGAGIYLRRVSLTLAIREGIFLPESRFTSPVLAAVESCAIVLGMCHFALHATLPELWLAAAIGIITLVAIAILRRIMAVPCARRFQAAKWISGSKVRRLLCRP